MHSVILWGLAFRFCSFYFRPHPPPPQIARKAFTKIRFSAGETRARSPVLTDLTSVFTNHESLVSFPCFKSSQAFHQHPNEPSLGAQALLPAGPALPPLHLLPRPLLTVPQTRWPRFHLSHLWALLISLLCQECHFTALQMAYPSPQSSFNPVPPLQRPSLSALLKRVPHDSVFSPFIFFLIDFLSDSPINS